jgi:hypothetical protein
MIDLSNDTIDLPTFALSTKISLCAVSGVLSRLAIAATAGVNKARADAGQACEIVDQLREEFNNFKGPITEQTVRRAIENREGIPYADSRRLKSLDEVCQWIGEGIGATDLQIRCAKMKIISTFIKDFRHFNSDGTTEVCHFYSIATNGYRANVLTLRSRTGLSQRRKSQHTNSVRLRDMQSLSPML